MKTVTPKNSARPVYLLHGLGRSSLSMVLLSTSARRYGFEPVSISYPSTTATIDDCVAYVRERIELDVSTTPFFIGHSMGCVIVNRFLAQHCSALNSRAVYLAPPFRGVRAARIAMRLPLMKWRFGPALSELASARVEEIPESVRAGIIAGHFSSGRFPNPLLREENDGLLMRSEVLPLGSYDLLLTKTLHPLFVASPQVIHAAFTFLNEQRFEQCAKPNASLLGARG